MKERKKRSRENNCARFIKTSCFSLFSLLYFYLAAQPESDGHEKHIGASLSSVRVDLVKLRGKSEKKRCGQRQKLCALILRSMTIEAKLSCVCICCTRSLSQSLSHSLTLSVTLSFSVSRDIECDTLANFKISHACV